MVQCLQNIQSPFLTFLLPPFLSYNIMTNLCTCGCLCFLICLTAQLHRFNIQSLVLQSLSFTSTINPFWLSENLLCTLRVCSWYRSLNDDKNIASTVSNCKGLNSLLDKKNILHVGRFSTTYCFRKMVVSDECAYFSMTVLLFFISTCSSNSLYYR